jgi:hypothetical protein
MIGALIVGAIFIAAGVAFGGWIIMLLWNAAIVSWVSAPALNFWQACGISLILGIIGGAFRSGK